MKDVTLTIRNNPSDNDEVFRKFLELIAWMDICSEIGHNSKFTVEFYGDYGAHFHFNTLEDSEEYEEIKKKLLDKYNESYWNEPFRFIIG